MPSNHSRSNVHPADKAGVSPEAELAQKLRAEIRAQRRYIRKLKAAETALDELLPAVEQAAWHLGALAILPANSQPFLDLSAALGRAQVRRQRAEKMFQIDELYHRARKGA
jgi:hypothetical protein